MTSRLAFTLATSFVVGTGCATVDPVFKAQAASELDCSEELEVTLVTKERSEVDPALERQVYQVSGCGQVALYETTCNDDADSCGQYRRIEGAAATP